MTVINNVPRDLLERARAAVASTNTSNWSSDLLRDIHAILSAPSPAGVDGLKVVGYFFQHEETGNVMSVDAQQVDWGFEANNPRLHRVCALADYDKAQAIIDGLRGEVERLHMQLAACGVVALANTIESAGEARQMHPDYMSASCSDVAGAVDREIALRAEREDMPPKVIP